MSYYKFIFLSLLALSVLDCVDTNDNVAPNNLTITMIATGGGNDALNTYNESHSCAILQNKKVKCWGGNTYGQLGYGNRNAVGDDPRDMGNNLGYVNLGIGRTAKYIAAGGLHTCAILDDNSIKCWGYNIYGQLGLESSTNMGDAPNEMGNSLPVVNLGTGRTARALALGQWHSCALLDNNTVKCWGYNFSGELGQGDISLRGAYANTMGDNLLAINLGTGKTALGIASGSHHACALLNDNSVKCWGYNQYGQLGQGSTATIGSAPNQMGDNLAAVNIGAGRTATALAAGGDGFEGHTCAIRDNNTLVCWGRNIHGQLGVGNVFDVGTNAGQMGAALVVANMGTGRTASQIRLGRNHTCAILDNSSIKCWGQNIYGELGIGNTITIGVNATDMGDNLVVTSLGTGLTAMGLALNAQSCVILNTGNMKCWGNNFNSALGLGDRVDRGGLPTDMGDSLPIVNVGNSGPPVIQ